MSSPPLAPDEPKLHSMPGVGDFVVGAGEGAVVGLLADGVCVGDFVGAGEGAMVGVASVL